MLFFKKKNNKLKSTQAEESQTTEKKKVTYTFDSVFPSDEIADEVFKILHEQKKGK